MAMDGDRLGIAIAAAVIAAAGETMTPAQQTEIEDKWKLVANEIVDEITGNATVASDGNTGTGAAGGPLPIVSLPGTVS